MSSYFDMLDARGKARYKEKLETVGLSIDNDPYVLSNADRFHSDMIQWLKIEYGHVFAYSISRPRTYTQEQLLLWKQLEAYNYFENGHVRTVLSMAIGGGSCVVLKAKVNPSQKGSDHAHAHEAWMIDSQERRADYLCSLYLYGWVSSSVLSV